MDVNEFKAVYSPLFTDAWKLFKKWGSNPPKGKEWEQFSNEIDELQKGHTDCERFCVEMSLACIKEVERLAGIKYNRRQK